MTRVWKVYGVLEQNFSDGTRMVESSRRPKRNGNERLGGRMMLWKSMTAMSMATTQRPGKVRTTRMIRWRSKHWRYRIFLFVSYKNMLICIVYSQAFM